MTSIDIQAGRSPYRGLECIWPLREVPLHSLYFFDAVACDEPTNDHLALTVINYTVPALEGSVIVIECDALSANNYYTSTCVEGRWEPNIGKLSAMCGEGMLWGHNTCSYAAEMH